MTGTLKEEDFYDMPNRLIFKSVKELYADGKTIDLITIMNALTKDSTLNVCGGIAYISEICRFVPSAENVEAYIDIITGESKRRQILSVAERLAESATNRAMQPDEIVSDASAAILSVLSGKHAEYEDAQGLCLSLLSQIGEAHAAGGKIRGVPTGIPTLDKYTNGLQKGELIILAARPSMGKSALAAKIAHNAASRHKLPCAVFSLEMPGEAIMQRLLSADTMVVNEKLKTGTMNADEWARVMSGMDRLSKIPLYINKKSGATPTYIRSVCNTIKAKHGLALIVIDYLQLMTMDASRRNLNYQQEVSEISKSLKGIAIDFNVPVLALSQLSRAPEGRNDHRPMLSDLRDSGSIEQDADIAMFIYRDWVYNKSSSENEAELSIAKNRNGSLGTISLWWHPANVMFTELDASRTGQETKQRADSEK